jgi:hypothetical protein
MLAIFMGWRPCSADGPEMGSEEVADQSVISQPVLKPSGPAGAMATLRANVDYDGSLARKPPSFAVALN